MPTGAIQGVGIGLREPHYAALTSCSRRLDWLEIVPENFIRVGGARRAALDRCAERWPIIAHGVSLGIGGPDPFDAGYVRDLKALLDRLDPPFYSDHLCYASIGGQQFYDLLPMPFSEAAVHHCARRIRELASRLERPVAVENISYYARMPGGELDEGAFVSAVIAEAGCGLLLDVNNVYVNARNHRIDPVEALEGLPLHEAVQIHLAGHVLEDGRLVDDHGSALVPEVWTLFERAIAKTGPIPALIEWDNAIPSLDRVLDEADQARARGGYS